MKFCTWDNSVATPPGAANVVSGPSRSLWSMVKTYLGTRNYSPLFQLGDNKGVSFYHLGFMASRSELWADTMAELIELYTKGAFTPVIDSVWDFEQVPYCSVHSPKLPFFLIS